MPKIETPFSFTEKPEPVPGDMRPEWRIAIILLALGKFSRGGKSSLRRLHVITWTLVNKKRREAFRPIVEGIAGSYGILIRFDPALDRAIAFAIGEKLAEREKGKKLKITSKGLGIANEIFEKRECLQEEMDFLASIKGIATEGRIEEILRMEPLL